MKKAIPVFCILFSTGCSANMNDSMSIKGEWINIDESATFYRTLTFADSTAIFTSLGDTIYRFKYSVEQSSRRLLLTDAFNKKEAVNILKANADSLILHHLWELKPVQRFSKKRK